MIFLMIDLVLQTQMGKTGKSNICKEEYNVHKLPSLAKAPYPFGRARFSFTLSSHPTSCTWVAKVISD